MIGEQVYIKYGLFKGSEGKVEDEREDLTSVFVRIADDLAVWVPSQDVVTVEMIDHWADDGGYLPDEITHSG